MTEVKEMSGHTTGPQSTAQAYATLVLDYPEAWSTIQQLLVQHCAPPIDLVNTQGHGPLYTNYTVHLLDLVNAQGVDPLYTS